MSKFDCNLGMLIGGDAVWSVKVEGNAVTFSASSWEDLRVVGEVIVHSSQTMIEKEEAEAA